MKNNIRFTIKPKQLLPRASARAIGVQRAHIICYNKHSMDDTDNNIYQGSFTPKNQRLKLFPLVQQPPLQTESTITLIHLSDHRLKYRY